MTTEVNHRQWVTDDAARPDPGHHNSTAVDPSTHPGVQRQIQGSGGPRGNFSGPGAHARGVEPGLQEQICGARVDSVTPGVVVPGSGQGQRPSSANCP